MDYLSNDKLNRIDYPLIKPECQVAVGGFFMSKNNCMREVKNGGDNTVKCGF